MINRHVTAIYCDDIRFEVGNKHSYIGVYFGKMFVAQFPLQLPKLCIAISVNTPIGMPFKKAVISVLNGKTAIAEIPLDESTLNTQVIPPEVLKNDVSDTERTFQWNTIVALSPFQIEGPTMLKIRVQTETEELRGPGLEIEMLGAVAGTASALQ